MKLRRLFQELGIDPDILTDNDQLSEETLDFNLIFSDEEGNQFELKDIAFDYLDSEVEVSIRALA